MNTDIHPLADLARLNKEFAGGKAGKKIDLAQWFARISELQDLLNDERWDQ